MKHLQLDMIILHPNGTNTLKPIIFQSHVPSAPFVQLSLFSCSIITKCIGVHLWFTRQGRKSYSRQDVIVCFIKLDITWKMKSKTPVILHLLTKTSQGN